MAKRGQSLCTGVQKRRGEKSSILEHPWRRGFLGHSSCTSHSHTPSSSPPWIKLGKTPMRVVSTWPAPMPMLGYKMQNISIKWIKFNLIKFWSIQEIYFYSNEFDLVDGRLQIVVQSEDNGNPAKGPTEYVVTVEHTPGARRAGRGRKNNLKLDWSFHCGCGSFARFPTLCKHIGACAIVHFH